MIRCLFTLLLTGCTIMLSGQALNIINQSDSSYLLFEAEGFTENHPSNTAGGVSWETKKDGKFLAIGTSSSRTFPNLDYGAGKVVYRIRVNSTGNYTLFFRRKLTEPNATFILPRFNEAATSTVRRRVVCDGGPDAGFVWQSSRRNFFLTANTTYHIILLPENTKGLLIDQFLLHADEQVVAEDLQRAPLVLSNVINESTQGLLAYNLPEIGNLPNWDFSKNESKGVTEFKKPTEGKGYYPYAGRSFLELNREGGKARLVMNPVDLSDCFLYFGDLDLNLRLMSPDESISNQDTVKIFAILQGLSTQTVKVAEYAGISLAYQRLEAKLPGNTSVYNKVSYVIEYTGNGNEKLWIDDLYVKYRSVPYGNVLLPPSNLQILEDTIILGPPFYTFSILGSLTDSMAKRSTFFWNFRGQKDTLVKGGDTLRYAFPKPGVYDITLTIKTRSFIDPNCDSTITVVTKTVNIPLFDPKKLEGPKDTTNTGGNNGGNTGGTGTGGTGGTSTGGTGTGGTGTGGTGTGGTGTGGTGGTGTGGTGTGGTGTGGTGTGGTGTGGTGTGGTGTGGTGTGGTGTGGTGTGGTGTGGTGTGTGTGGTGTGTGGTGTGGTGTGTGTGGTGTGGTGTGGTGTGTGTGGTGTGGTGGGVVVPTPTEVVGLQVYPNPTNDLLIIQTENLVPLTYELSNMRGQVLFKGTFTGQIVLSLGTQPVGTYFLRIINAKGELVGTVWRIIKR